ncbi:MAG: DinB family protein [Bacteroidota bacterium]|nr:DinB family protein [Bacteroidota bacterium]
MDSSFKEILWKQFGASIDMFENSITACPGELWNTDSKFWYNAYHALFFLDYYLSDEPENFSPPQPFTLSEFDPDGEMPVRVYSKEELLSYLKFCRQKCHDLIAGLTDETSAKRFVNQYRNYSVIEILLYNMRHVQHHAAQLNLLLRQGTDSAPDWVSQTKEAL